MSLISRVQYLTFKLNTLNQRIQPHLNAVDDTRNLGSEDLLRMSQEEADLDSQIQELENTQYRTKQEDKKLAKLRSKKEKVSSKKESFQERLVAKKNILLGKIKNTINKSVDETSGVSASVDLEEFQQDGSGGNLTFTPEIEAHDEVSTFVKGSLESPETLVTVTTTVTGLTSDGKAVTGTGTTPAGTIRTT